MRISKSTKQTFKVALTTGDSDGVGFEVSAKALAHLGPQKNTNIFIFRNKNINKKQNEYFKNIDKKFIRLTFFSVEAGLAFYDVLKKAGSLDSDYLFDVALITSPAEWVMACTHLCKNNFFDSLVTGPISKTSILSAGYNYVGHTGIFRSVFPKNKMFMGFVGKDFHVMLATDHQSLSSVEKTLKNKTYLKSVFYGAKKFSKYFKTKKDVALVGLNPHAGEKGLLGSFEKRYLHKKISGFSQPLPPDAAFLKKNWSQFQFYLALYHDQGLVPFKMHHGQDCGVHVTIGLPFLRTSVDHGTASDIFNKNIANPASMIDAIQLNIKLLNGAKI